MFNNEENDLFREVEFHPTQAGVIREILGIVHEEVDSIRYNKSVQKILSERSENSQELIKFFSHVEQLVKYCEKVI